MAYGKGSMSKNSTGPSEAPVRSGVTKDSSDRGNMEDTCTPMHKPSIDVGGQNESKGKKGQT